MCGVFAITNAQQSSKLAYLGLFALQHRGQESAGIASLHAGEICLHREKGLVADIFKPEILTQLQGNAAIGHVRYSTAGGDLEANIQPIYARVGGVPVAIVHNGNIVNAQDVRQELEAQGAILQGTADTEIALHLMAKSSKISFREKLRETAQKLMGAFSLIILTPTHVYALVDSFGYRPLSLARMPTENGLPSYVVASETCAMDLVGAEFSRDILPGEMIQIELKSGKLLSFSFSNNKENSSQKAKCIFEHIYFARPDSLLWGILPNDTRFAMGQALVNNAPVPADMVIAIPDSGIPMAMGYAEQARIPYKIGFIRNHYVGRTFIEPIQKVRNFQVRLKLNPIKETVRGKKLIVVDDSIVRGTTSLKIIEMLRDAGAKEVHMRIGSPPIKWPCFYGIDTPKRKNLIAAQIAFTELNKFLKADSLAFLTSEQLLSVMNSMRKNHPSIKAPQKEWCMACFDGHYQDPIAQKQGIEN